MQSTETSRMLQLISGFHVSRALYVAATLGLADKVAGGTHDIDELAQATHADAGALLRTVRLLATVGVFAIDARGQIQMTPLAHTLRSDAPSSLQGWAIDQLGGEHYQAWGELLHSVRTGSDAFHHLFGQSPWQHRADNPASAQAFDAGMSSFLQAHHAAVIAAYPFARFQRIVDLAGGDGQFMVAVLQSCPELQGAVFELPHVANKATQRLAEAGLQDRGHALAGSLFETLPTGADAYVLSRVIHDWADADALRILRNAHVAAAPTSTLLLVERVLAETCEATAAQQAIATSDLNMLVMTGGRERSVAQYRQLLGEAGWWLTRVIDTDTALSVIEAVPA